MSDTTGHAPPLPLPLPLPAWGHHVGLLNLGEAIPLANPHAAYDRMLFSERISRYCWGYDERRTDLLAACFTEDGIWEGDVLGQVPIGPFKGRERIIKWLSEFWPHQHDQRRHMILNTIVEEQSANLATTYSYLLLMSSDGRESKLETTGFYRTRYRKVGDHWLIERLTAGFDAPFWPGDINRMSQRGRARHGVGMDETG